MTEFLALESLSVSLAVAFVFGMVSRMVGLPPMMGFLAAGFALNQLGIEATEALRRIADMGVLLLLFTIGLKLRPEMLARRHVYGSALGHMAVFSPLMAFALMGLGVLGFGHFLGLGLAELAVIAFALSFSSTVFTVKVFEEKGELGSVHGKAALGILIIQDLAAVAFLVASTGKWPSIWALALVALVVVRPAGGFLLDRMGRGELIPLFGLFAVLVLGAATFKTVGLKPDLGALLLGMLIADHKRSSEVADSLLAFKDVFLIGFFLNIGLGSLPTTEIVIAALVLVALLPVKMALFFFLLCAFHMRARTALMGAIGLSTYSEFGLIVGAVAVDQQIIAQDWLLILALALAISFLLVSPLNAVSQRLYDRFHGTLRRFERRRIEPTDRRTRIGGTEIVIFGMGRLGASIYGALCDKIGADSVLGIETDGDKVQRLSDRGWNVVHGDATDSDFWRRAGRPSSSLRAVLLAMPEHRANIYALEQIRAAEFDGFIAALARFPDEIERLREAGADVAFDVYGEAGTGFAADVAERLGLGVPEPAASGSNATVPDELLRRG